MNGLNLGLVGNSAVSALVNAAGDIVWSCFPRFDGDPVFCALLEPEGQAAGQGMFQLELADFVRSEQAYIPHTAVLVTRLFDQHGGCVEISDFAPRLRLHGRMFFPRMLIRRVSKRAGSPRIRVRVRPLFDHGAVIPEVTSGSHHVRYVGPELTLRLTTDASVSAVLEERSFYLDEHVTFVLGADETLHERVDEIGRRFLDETVLYWQEWVRSLFVPVDWQEEVIRAAITLKLNAFDDTGAIVAAMTTSIPEHADSGRNWDYRYCWLRDAYFVVNALNRLGATRTMERYLQYILNVAAETGTRALQPVYGISGEAALVENIVPGLKGYRGMGPVRIGNQAYEQVQHDVYGAAILAATHTFFDCRLAYRGDASLFARLEPLGERAIANFDQTDAGIWELRGSARVHTYSSLMCWAGCDRLARIATRLGLNGRADYWREHAQRLHATICERAWSEKRQAFVAAWGGDTLDASMLLLHEFGFLAADDPRFASTVNAIEQELMHDGFIYRYVEQDDFGAPQNAFLVCSFWYVYALHALGRRREARAMFERLLGCCNHVGLLAEDVDPRSGEQWGNFVQTYSMVGLINCALRLSRRWDEAY